MDIPELFEHLEDTARLGFVTSSRLDSEDDVVHIYEVWTTKSLDEVRAAVAKSFPKTDCGHEHDCCGCWFRFTTRTVSQFDKEGEAYIIIDHWLRNI